MINKLKYQRLLAFTLMELLVTMVITSIVISMSLYIYINFEKIIGNLLKYGQNNVEIAMLKRTIDNDFVLSNYVFSQASGFVVHSKECDKKYLLTDQFVLRTVNGVTDTFRIKVHNYNLNKVYTSGSLIESIEMQIMSGKDIITLYCKKDYDAATLYKDWRIKNEIEP